MNIVDFKYMRSWMLSTLDCLIPIVLLVIIFLLVRHIVSDRYKSSKAKIIVSAVLR